jgi:hypothetical protein
MAPADTVAWDVKVTNNGPAPVTLKEFSTSTTTFGVTGTGSEYPLVVSPDESVAPGETKTLHLGMTDPIWKKNRLLAVGEVQAQLGGILTFQDPQGNLERDEVVGELVPDYQPM